MESFNSTCPNPLVSCIMPTFNRRKFVTRAIDLFFRQEYEPKELIIVDDGTDSISDLVPSEGRIRYLRLEKREPVGMKRNLACENALGELIVHWDDDDWITEWRIRYQVGSLLKSGADICGLDSLYFYNPTSDEAWRYTYIGKPSPWLAGGTLCYRKSLWRRHPFPEINVGEDARFVWGCNPDKVLALPNLNFYVAFVHSANTSPKNTRDRAWHPVAAAGVRAVMGIGDPSARMGFIVNQEAL